MKIYRIRKKSFLLAEILLAMFLIAVCALPLVKGPIVIFRKEIENIEKIEEQRIANLAFFEIKKILYEQKIPWSELGTEGKNIKRYLKEASYNLPITRGEKKVKIHYRIFPLLPQKDPDKKPHRYLAINIYFNDAQKEYAQYQIYAKKA